MEKELGKFLLDVAKLVIGGVILVSIMNDITDRWIIYTFGSLSSLVLIFMGLLLINENTEE